MKNKKGFTLIELLAVIVILAVIALIVTPIVTGIITSAKESANARSVEGHIKNVEYAITSSAFSSSGELTKFDGNDISETTLAGLNITYPSGDNIKCNSYTIKNGTVTVAENCQDPKWSKQYCYDEGSNAKICTTRYRINTTLTNLTISGQTKVNDNESYTGTLSAGDNYSLPTTITVTMSENTLVLGTGYAYDSTTGVITIAKVTGAVTITANGIIANGTAVYFNPETGVKCTSVEAVSTTGTKTGCMKWYVFGDEDGTSTVNLLLDHNVSPILDWNETGSTTEGPSTTFLNELWSDTNGWIGVPTRTDSYSLSNGIATYTINYSGHRARLITANEIAKIIGNATFNEVSAPYAIIYFDTNTSTPSTTCTSGNTTGCKYGWLYDRTKSTCTNYGCLNDSDVAISCYWTATAIADKDKNSAWVVVPTGHLDYGGYTTTYSYGVRPVITIPKSLIY